MALDAHLLLKSAEKKILHCGLHGNFENVMD
jgi:hypothetical protein